MKNYTILLSLFLSIYYNCFGQNNLVKKWDYRFGGTIADNLTGLVVTKDGGYILGGWSASGIGGDKTQATHGAFDYWIVKLDSLGNKQWDKDFGGTSGNTLSSLQQTKDGGYILGGTSSSGIGGDKTQATQGSYDYWIIKLDSLGIKQWDKDFGGTDHDELFSLQQTMDGGYILGGWSLSGIGGDKTQNTVSSVDYWIIKTDSLGVKQWDKDFGGTANDYLYSLQETQDGGYILGGWSNSGIGGDKTQATQGSYDYWIVKTDSLGNKQWDKDFGGTDVDYLYFVLQTKNEGYLLGGFSGSGIGGDKTQASYGNFDWWIVRTDSLGNKQWDKDYGGNSGEEFGNICSANDGGFALAGTSYSYIGGTKTENNLGPEQTWVVKIDSLGNKQWDKTIFTNGHDEAGYVVQTKDGCYAFANYTDAGIGGYKTQAIQGNVDYWIVKFCDTTQSLPHASFTSSDTSFCTEFGQCISFFDHSTGNPTSWQWQFTGANPSSSNQQNPTNICYTIPGTYPVTLVVSNGTITDTLNVSPLILYGTTPPPPTITVRGGDTLVSSHCSSYQWYLNGSPITGATDSFYVAHQGGTYAVQITDSTGGCNSISNGFALGLEELTGNGDIIIYPNPASQSVVISWPSAVGGNKDISIINVLGEKVYGEQQQIANSKLQLVLNFSSLTNGIYFLKIESGEAMIIKKFVVIHK